MEEKIYITRKSNLFEHSNGRGISLEEWSRFAGRDPEMRLDNATTVTLANGSTYTYTSPGTAIWLDRLPGESAPREILFDYIDGAIEVNDPDARTLDKIRHIAFKLNSRIFSETKRWTEELPVSLPAPAPGFLAGGFFGSLKRYLPRIGYFFQHFAFAPHPNEADKINE